jgi:hypothetical protein
MDIQDVLLKIGYTDLRDFGKEWRTCPIYRSSDNKTSLCIKKATGEWYDFSGRVGGGLAQLVQLTLKLGNIQEAEDILGDVGQIVSTNQHKYELWSQPKFNKELLFKLKKDHSYWEKRGIPEKTITNFEGGTTFNGRMAYRYVFPIFNDRNDLVGFSGRRLTDNPDFPKWKHLGKKSSWLYPLKLNEKIISKHKEIVLVESIGDMLSLWEAGIKNTIVTFGVVISPKIIQLMIKMDIQKIFISFNNEPDNQNIGNEAAKEARTTLLKFFDQEQVVIALPEAKDFGDMNQEQINLWQTLNNLKN